MVRGAAWTALQAWVLRSTGLLTFVVLGRILDPAQIGAAALAIGMIGLTTLLADAGLATYLVRAESVSDAESSTAFWMTLCLAGVCMIAVFGFAEPLATLVGAPEIAVLLRVLSLNVVVAGLSAVPLSLLTRALQLQTIAVREMVSGVVGGVVGVSLAVTGAGVWSLVGQSLTQSIIALILLWRLGRWRPDFAFSFASARRIVRFGLPLFGTNLIQGLRDRVDQVLLGVLAGVSVLGYWAVATRILSVGAELTLAVLDRVALPVFSRSQRDTPRLARVLENATAVSAALFGPLLALVASTSPALIPLLFGPGWGPAIVPAQVLCAAYAIGALTYFNRAAYIARGRTGLDLGLTLLGLALHVGTVAVAAPFGLTALSYALVAESAVLLLLHATAARFVLVAPWSVLGRGAVALAVSALSFVVMIATAHLVEGPAVVEIALMAFVGAGVYLAVLRVASRPLTQEILDDVRGLLRRSRSHANPE